MDVVDAGLDPNDDIYIYTLAAGMKWAHTALTYSFPTYAALFTGYGPNEEPAHNFDILNAQQRAAVKAAFAALSSFTNLTFTELTGSEASSATLRFGMSDDPATAYAYLPNQDEIGGDSWYNNSGGQFDNPVLGNYAYMGFFHEIGHALGLDHPHESAPAMPLDRDYMAWTVMSYRSSPGGSVTGYTNETWGFAQTYMAEDIATMQALYGANYSYNSGNTVYSWSPITGEEFINGAGQGAPGANRVFTAVWDGGGDDTYDFSNYPANSTFPYTGLSIDLRPGGWTTLQGQTVNTGGQAPPGNIANAFLYQNDTRSLVENAIGSPSADIIYGNDAANVIHGGGGNDQIYAYGGDDILWGDTGGGSLNGGDGNDIIHGGSGGGTLIGEAGDDRLEAGIAGNWLTGGTGDDTLLGNIGDDVLIGDEGNDLIIGDVGNDDLQGRAGDDTLFGGPGNDTLKGGSGIDTMTGGPGDDTYEVFDAGDQAIELDAEGIDTVQLAVSFVLPATIENAIIVTGGAINVTGNAADNVLVAQQSGNNIIDGGSGADTMNGGSGDDTYYVDNPNDKVIEGAYRDSFLNPTGDDTVYSSVSYSLPSLPITITEFLPDGPRQVATDSFEIETLILTGSANIDATGNAAANTLQGNAGNNVLDGKAGNDTLYGNDGDDLLIGVSGNDSLNGGNGNDGFYFGAALNTADVVDGGADTDTLAIQGNYPSLTLGTMQNVEVLLALSGSDTRFGDTANNRYDYTIATNDGNVAFGQVLTISATGLLAGEDLAFVGSAENDGAFRVFTGQGNDVLTGGAGSDGFFFGADGNLTAADRVLGGANIDSLALRGNYVGLGAVQFSDASFSEIEVVVALSGHTNEYGGFIVANGFDYDMTMADGNVASGQLLQVIATTLGADESIRFDGQAELNGAFRILSGAGDDTLYGGAGNDTLYGGLGADHLIGGKGDDTFAYRSVLDSTSSAPDTISGFDATDVIDLSYIDAITRTPENDAFSFIGRDAFTSHAGELRVVDQGGGNWVVQGDVNGDSIADLWIVVQTTNGHPLGIGDFSL